jgi:NADH-quinone oxidoreductase subunit F
MARKLLLEKANVEGIRGFDVYRREGGYRSVEKALKMLPADIVEEVKKVVCVAAVVQVSQQE